MACTGHQANGADHDHDTPGHIEWPEGALTRDIPLHFSVLPLLKDEGSGRFFFFVLNVHRCG